MKRLLALSAALLVTAGCSAAPMASPTSAGPASSMSAPMSASASASASASSATKDIVDTAVAAGDFKTLATALTAAGLVDTLKGPGPFTVFAPTDAAFAKLPKATLDKVLADKAMLTKILTYHVVPGEVTASQVTGMDGDKVKTVEGGTFTVKVAGGAVTLVDGAGNTVKVTKTDIMASNGVIHVIDTVLMP